MKKMNKAVALLCLAAVGASAFAFTGCKQDEAGKVMNVALNPEVEFVLDANDKVVSVNALNEEGNLIISAEAFADVEGMKADAAAKLFIEVSKETGFLVSGNAQAGSNEINISVSGDTKAAQELYEDVKTEINKYVNEESINATIAGFKAITEEQIQALVAECAPYLEAAEIEAMEYAQLVEELETSRKETAGFYSQAIKDAYYGLKARAMRTVEVDALKEKYPVFADAIDRATEAYNEAADELEKLRYEKLIALESNYQKALADFRQKKVDFLNYRNYVAELESTTEDDITALTNLQSVMETAYSNLESVGELANSAIDTAQSLLTSTYNIAMNAVDLLGAKLSEVVSKVEQARKSASITFNADFENKTISGSITFGDMNASAKTSWNDMRTALEAGYQEESAE